MDEPIDARSSELASGEVYAGWKVERELARGGMGVLYLARHPRLPRTDVIKVLSPYLSSSQRFRDRFLAEATRMSSLSHPHVMPIHDSGQADDGTLYLVMPFIAGGDLRKLIRETGPLEPRRAARLVAQVGAALDAAHRIGVVHRDVKPENVLLASVEPDDNDHALLTDFGISREELSATTLTATGELLLTPAYAAPEQALGHVVDARADQYALACILVELLTGRPPYENATPVALLMAHLQDPVPKVAARIGLSAELDDVLSRALSKQPENRYANCRDFANAAAAVLDPGGVRVTGETAKPVMPAADATVHAAVPVSPPPSSPPPVAPPRSQPPSSHPPQNSPPPNAPTPQLPQPFGDGYGFGAPPPQRKSRRGVVLAVVGVLVVAGAGTGIAVAVSGGDGDKPATTTPAASAQQYDALLARLPPTVSQSGACQNITGQLPANEKGRVQTLAKCTVGFTDATLTVTYRTLLGTSDQVTNFRQSVLGLGGKNHHGGNCATLTLDPGEQPSAVGFAQDVKHDTVDGRIFCSVSATDPKLWYLQFNLKEGSLPILTEAETTLTGGVATADARLSDLYGVSPVN